MQSTILEPSSISLKDTLNYRFRQPKKKFWEDCLAELQNEIPGPFFDSFILPLQAVENSDSGEEQGADGDRIVLTVKDKKSHRYITERYFPLIEKRLQELSFRGQVRLVVREDGLAFDIADKAEPGSKNLSKEGIEKEIPTFCTNFYPHPANGEDIRMLKELDFPYVAAFLFGPSGAGKSVFTMGLIAELNNKNIPAKYLTMESFLTEFSSACQEKRTIKWRADLRKNRVLVIDDFQFLKATAEKSQEEIRSLIDDFQRTGQKLLLCSDRPIDQVPLLPDLRSRLYMAGTIRLHWADQLGREKILFDAFTEFDIKMETEAIRYLANRIRGDGRKLRSAALRIKHQRLLDDTLLAGDYSRLDSQLQELYTKKTDISPKKILSCVSAYFNLTPESVVGPAREQKYVLARNVVSYICCEITDMTYNEIASLVNRKQHGSIIHSCKKIGELMKKDLFFEKQMAKLIAELSISA